MGAGNLSGLSQTSGTAEEWSQRLGDGAAQILMYKYRVVTGQ
jgi:hypothetical protein